MRLAQIAALSSSLMAAGCVFYSSYHNEPAA